MLTFSEIIYICKNFNYCLENGEFPWVFKHADVVPVHKKKIKINKANYRPTFFLTCLKFIKKWCIKRYMNIFTRFFHQNNVGCQHCLIVILPESKESRDKGEKFGAFFTDLSKAFDCIDHNPLITKLSWYWVAPKSLNIIFSYLCNRTQDVRVNSSYSRKNNIKYGVP